MGAHRADRARRHLPIVAWVTAACLLAFFAIGTNASAASVPTISGIWYTGSTVAGSGTQPFGAATTVSGAGNYVIGATVTWNSAGPASFSTTGCAVNLDGTMTAAGPASGGAALASTCFSPTGLPGSTYGVRMCLTSPYLLDSTAHKLNLTGTWTVPTTASTGNAAVSLIYSGTATGTCSATAAGPSTLSSGAMPGQTTFYAKPPTISATATASNNNSGNLTIAFTPASNPNDPSTYVVNVHDLTTDTYANDACPANHGPATTAQSCTYTGVVAHSYQAQVVSTNSYSSTTGGFSSTATPSGLSSAPTLNSAVANSNGTVTLTWSPPSTLNGATIISYTATATDQATSVNQTWTGISGAASSYTTAGALTAGHTYTFKITANESTSPATIDSNSISGVTIYTAPGVPTGVAAAAGNNQATVSWAAPANTGGTPITSYTLSVTNTFTSTTTVITGVAASPYVATGLTNGQSHTVKVAAVNSVGAGSYSSSVTFTPTGPPAAGPSTVTATAGNSTVALSWSQLTAAQLNGATASGYTATLTDSTTPGNGGQTCSTASAGATSCSITGLTNGDTYTASVVANTNYGPSPATTSSAFVPAGPPAAPGAPTSTVNALVITVTWSAPAANGAAITGYTLSYASGGAGTACTTTTATSCTVNTPTAAWGTAYTFTVHATNSAGAGPESAASAPVTTYTTPLTPTAPTATQAPAGARVTWAAPSARGSAITSYTVTATDTPAIGGAAKQTATSVTVDGTLLAADFTGLTVGDGYTFTVSATNAAGTSPASPASGSVTPYGPPAQMTAPTVLAVGDATATIGWTAPNLNSYLGTPTYAVTAIDGTTPASGGQTCTSTSSSCTITGLVNGDSYTVVVTATDPAGTSPPSPQSANFTPTGVPGVPGAPTATATGANTAQITLGGAAAANGSPITRYTISFTDTTNSATGPACTITSPATSCTATQLAAGDTYTFKASATNAVGTGPTGPGSAPITAYGAPVPPTAPTATAGVRTATITWAAAAAQGTPTTGYTVLAVDATSSNRGGQTCAADGQTLSCTVTGLTASDSYTFKVAATNIVGTSAYSPASNPVVPYDVAPPPTSVTAIAGDGTATISWAAPASDSGSRITSYNVTAIDTTSADRGGQTCTTASTSCVVTGLTDGDSYYAAVVATNAAGPSTSATSAPFVPNGRPSPPASVTAIAGAGSATLSWAQGDGRGAAITGYTATATDQTTPANGGQTCTATSTTCTITGLTVNDSYVFTVTATNVNGDSGASSPSPPVKPYARPSGLTAPNATAGPGKAVVSWTAPDANSNPITGYTVTATDLTTPANGGQTCTATTRTTCTVTGLTAGDSYTFTYTATNKAGQSDPSGPSNAVLIYTVPVAPASVAATAGDHQVTITWAPPASTGGSPITSYTVTLADTTTPSEGGQSYTTPDSTVRTHTFTGLTNGDTYIASVTASNTGGTGDATDSLPFTPFGLPAAPAAPTAAPSGPARIAVSWTAPNANGSPITSYEVTATDADDTTRNPLVCTTSGGLTCSIGNLVGGDHYQFTVKAANAAGTSTSSPASAPVQAIDVPTRPATVTAAAGRASIAVSWTAPANTNGAQVSSYTVTASIVGDEHSYRTPDGATFSHTFTGLQPGQAYSVTVAATNAAGDSPPSSTTATPYDAPSAPRSVTAVRGPNQVTVSWLAPTQTYDLDTSYQVALTNTDTANNGGQTCSTTQTACTITGLTNGEHYTATVTASNLGGASTPAQSSVFIPMNSPAAPATPTATAGRLAGTVTWTAPADNGSPITGYTVTAADQTDPAHGGQTCSTTETSCTLTGLALGDSYTFTVVATNTVGDSLPSSNSNPVRPYDVPDAPAAPRGTPLKGGAGISWTSVTGTNGSPITKYTVTAADLTDPVRGGQTCSASGSDISCAMTDLTPGDRYTFTLVATNAAGNSPASPASAEVIPRSTTSPPTDVRVVTSDSSATVTWTAPTDPVAPITGYTVTLTDSTHPANGGQTCTTTTETSCTLAGLTNGDAYTATVTAASAGGNATATYGPFNTYGQPGAPGAPTATAGAGQATVSWTASDPNGYTGQGQRITYTVTAADLADPAHGGQTCASPAATTCIVKNLTPGERYTFTVVGSNDQQSSPATAPTAPVTPYALPARPATVTATGGDHSAVVEWTAPVADGYSPILSYTVTLEDSTVSAHGGQTFTTATASTLTHTFTGLTNGELYRATVYATNAAGDGLAAASDFFTPAGPPAQPAAPTATLTGPTSISVTWTMPFQNASAITGYTVLFGAGGTGPACTTAAATTSCTVDNLTAGATYSFRVVATNSMGDSAASPASAPITLAGQPATCPEQSSTSGCGSVIVDGSITLSLDASDQSFTLQGAAGSTTTGPDNSISYIVTTNNAAGYTVTVQADTPTLAAGTAGNRETLAAGVIVAAGSALPGHAGSTGGRAVLDTGGVVYSQSSRSDGAGDEHQTLFTADLPFINSDSYTGSVTFTATAN